MLWVLIRSASLRRFKWVPTTRFIEKYEKYYVDTPSSYDVGRLCSGHSLPILKVYKSEILRNISFFSHNSIKNVLNGMKNLTAKCNLAKGFAKVLT